MNAVKVSVSIFSGGIRSGLGNGFPTGTIDVVGSGFTSIDAFLLFILYLLGRRSSSFPERLRPKFVSHNDSFLGYY